MTNKLCIGFYNISHTSKSAVISSFILNIDSKEILRIIFFILYVVSPVWVSKK